MNSLDGLLKENVSIDLLEFVSQCGNGEELIRKVGNQPFLLLPIIQNMRIEGNEPLAARLLYRVSPDELNPEIKKVETVLRNRGVLDGTSDHNITLNHCVRAHKSILALESPYFRGMTQFVEFQNSEARIEIPDGDISPEAYQRVVEYMYLSDERREMFVSTLDGQLLLEIAQLACYWEINELQERCDEELCNILGELYIEANDINDWLAQAHFIPKFVRLLEFLHRVAGEDHEENGVQHAIAKMHSTEGAAWLVSKCSPEERTIFSTLKTKFGKACRIPPGTFGVAEWEEIFPVTIEEEQIPPLPPNIHQILEQEDPCKPGKKVKETCMLFLYPNQVILHKESGDISLTLDFDGVEELAKNARNPERRTQYESDCTGRNLKHRILPVEKSRWVLMRKKISSCLDPYPDQGDQEKPLFGGDLRWRQTIKEPFQQSRVMDAVLLNVISYASTGQFIRGARRKIIHSPYAASSSIGDIRFVDCQELQDIEPEDFRDRFPIAVGEGKSSRLSIEGTDTWCVVHHYYHGELGTWKF
ncbi:MAG: BTB/POZ domain-containing protein [Waddliaceae bacterium]